MGSSDTERAYQSSTGAARRDPSVYERRMPRVCVITRTLRRPLFLSRALESVARQSFRDLVHLVVNDGGEPEPVDALVGGYPGVRTLHLAPTRGMEAASNAALGASDSEYCALLDDDDTWAPDFLERMVAGCPRTSGGVICRTTLVLEHLEHARIVEDSRRPFNPELFSLSLPRLALRNRFTSNAFLFRRELATAVGGFDDTLPVLGDWDFNLRCLLRAHLEVLPVELARYHQRPAERGAAGNSLYARSDEHARARSQLVNKLLRQGSAQTTAMGLLVDAGEHAERAERLLGHLERLVSLPARIARLTRR